MTTTTTCRGPLLSVLLVCQLIGLVLFLKGFFPIKKAIPGAASLADLPPEPGMEGSWLPLRPVLDRLVIVLIDALRADFVLPGDERMEYVNQLVRNNETLSFLAKAHPPTVTMPRIKALVTGSIPGFVDVLLNAISTALQDDNLMAQLTASRRQIVFYGDDTWIKLFPGLFERSDGTTSFFVTDYTEVDNNVTRHLDKELHSTDWDVMILHYLGLDHIGHLAGPTSPLIGPKLKEMDDIIRDIHRNLIRWDQEMGTHSAVVLCGDHGMSDSGSHGGASLPETSTPLVFLSSRFQGGKGSKYTGIHVDQIDMVSSLSILLGTAIPQNSIGSLIPQLLHFHTPRERLRAFQLNAHQLSKVLITNGHSPDDVWELGQATRLHKEWLQALQTGVNQNTSLDIWAEQITKQYNIALKKMSNKVAGSLSCYDLHAMASGIVILLQVLFWVLYVLMQANKSVMEVGGDVALSAATGFVMGLVFLAAVAVHLTVCSSASLPGTCSSETLCSSTPSAMFFSSLLILLSTFSIGTVILVLPQTTWHSIQTINTHLHSMLSTPTRKILALGTTLHVFSLLSSSFVEEEHQTWYFLTISYFIWGFYDIMRSALRQVTEAPLESEEQRGKQIAGDRNVNAQDKINYKVNLRRYDLRSFKSEQRELREGQKTVDSAGNSFVRGETASILKKKEYFSVTYSLWNCIPRLLVSLLYLISIRVSRSLNQTGIKWANQPDISDFLVKPESKLVLSLVVMISISIIIVFFVKVSDLFSAVVFTAGLTSVYFYRTATGCLMLPWRRKEPITDGLIEARLAYMCSIVLLVRCVTKMYRALKYKRGKDDQKEFVRYREMLVEGLDIFLMALVVVTGVLLRAHNVAVLAAFAVQEYCLSAHFIKRGDANGWSTVILFYWLGQAMYFALGNSNSLSTVDIAAGYIGMRGHHPAVASLLMCLATYAGPLLWMTSLVKHLVKFSSSYAVLHDGVYRACVTLSLPQSLLLCVYCILVYGQRYHLFVWSVFSPKLLYEAMRAFVMLLSTSVILVFAFLISK